MKPRVKNRKAVSDSLLKEYRKGLPDGFNESYFKKLRMLFDRLEELEVALRPFAMVAERERKFGGDVYMVNKSDCERAYDVLDPNNSI